MRQNSYDDPEMFSRYAAMPRSVGGLAEAGEWEAFRSILPDLRGRRVLDLGCGLGWHARYAAEHGARSVVGIDISERMIARAIEMTSEPGIRYLRQAIEDVSFEAGEFDVVLSSLALHYVERFDDVCRRVWRCLVPGGTFAISVEHPMFTALGGEDWCLRADGSRAHWPVDKYMQEGIRRTSWLVEGVIKYHRTIATLVNTLVGEGFRIRSLLEPAPPAELLARHPEWRDETRRPMFLLMAAVRGDSEHQLG